MQTRYASLTALVLVLVTGCAGIEGSLTNARARYEIPPTQREAITICHGHGCRERSAVALTATEWREVEAFFVPLAATAEEERARIARAIAHLETITGAKAGTSADHGGTFGGTGQKGQMDCVDEMLTTAGYLQLLQAEGLLRFHIPHRRVTATFFEQSFWPHTTATLRETATGEEWAVDSWVFDNGAEPLIVPLASWRDNSYRDGLDRAAP